MPEQIRAFGTDSPVRVNVLVNVPHESDPFTLSVPRTIWFDRDMVDGHWLVWVSDPNEYGPDTDGDDTGAIVVHDPTVVTFLETLGQLLVSPLRFVEEPVFGTPPARAIGPPAEREGA